MAVHHEGSSDIIRDLIVFLARPDISVLALMMKSSGKRLACSEISVCTGSDCPIGPHQVRSSMGRVVARPAPGACAAAADGSDDRQPARRNSTTAAAPVSVE